MAKVKQTPCCARLQARLVMDQANLRRLAQRAAKRHEKGLSTRELQDAMAKARADIKTAEEAIIEHDANHAGGGL